MQLVVEEILTNYQVLGKGKKVLLVLPGWKRPASEWIAVSKNLSDEYKIILLDLPGFGVSALPKSTFGVYEYADFVKKFLEKLKIEKCTVIGHSFGGRLGIVLAAEGKMVDKLILVDSGGIEQKSFYTKLVGILRVFFYPILAILPISTKTRISNMIGSVDYKDSGEMRKIFVKIVNQDLTVLLPKIKVPTVIIWGDRDNQLPVSETKIFKKEISGAKARIVWGAGHDPHLQKPEQLINILKEIL